MQVLQGCVNGEWALQGVCQWGWSHCWGMSMGVGPAEVSMQVLWGGVNGDRVSYCMCGIDLWCVVQVAREGLRFEERGREGGRGGNRKRGLPYISSASPLV